MDFYLANRAELLVQSVLFVLSAGVFLLFMAGLRGYLDRAEGHSGRMSSVVNDVGRALATIADVPVVVLVAMVGVFAFLTDAFPAWVGWLSLLAAVSHLLAWVGVAVDGGPFVPGGWVTFVVYPVFVVWLVAVIAVMISRAGPRRQERSAQGETEQRAGVA